MGWIDLKRELSESLKEGFNLCGCFYAALACNSCATNGWKSRSTFPASPDPSPILSWAQRAHDRLAWHERLVRNTRAPTEGQVTIKLFGVPEAFATFFALPTG